MKCAGRAAGERFQPRMQRHGWCGGNACSVTAQPQAVTGMLRMCTVLPHDGVDDVAYRMLHITSSMLCALRVGCRCIAYAYATVDAAPCADAVRHSRRVDLADGDDRLRFQRRYLRSIQERCSSRDCRSKVSLRDSVQQRGRWTPYAMHFASRASADVAASTPAETAVCAESVQSSRWAHRAQRNHSCQTRTRTHKQRRDTAKWSGQVYALQGSASAQRWRRCHSGRGAASCHPGC